MPKVQTSHEIDELLARRLIGQSIRQLQVLAPNALKTVLPETDTLAGAQVTATTCSGRLITIETRSCTILINLERTGRVDPLDMADVWSYASSKAQPTVRVLLDDGSGVDLAEPAKTKRITVSLVPKPS